jgi:Lar family restriction alleviation protein
MHDWPTTCRKARAARRAVLHCGTHGPDYEPGPNALEHLDDIEESCPFCGTGISFEDFVWPDDDFVAGYYSVRCTECGALGPSEETLYEAVQEWNEREGQ